MPDKAHSKKRIRPVIEEIVEESAIKSEKPSVEEPPEMPKKHAVVEIEEDTPTEHLAGTHVDPVEESPSPEVNEVEPVDTHEQKARELLSELGETTHTSKEHMNLKLVFVLTVLTALVVGFISGGVYVYFTGIRDLNDTAVTSPSPSPVSDSDQSASPKPTASPAGTPIPVSTLATFKMNVLNGSGQVGGAGKVKSLLENAGFKVANTGNASSFNYTNTVVQAIPSVSAEVLNVVKKSLSSDYSVEIGDALPTSSSYDIVVTVGSK